MTVSFVLLAFAVWLVWRLEGKQMELSFLLSFAASLGAAVGTRSSLSRVESQEQLEQAKELSTLLEINQRVLRHNLRNDLSVVFGYLDEIESTTDREDVQDDCRVIRTRLTSLEQMSERARQIVSIWEQETTRTFNLGSLLTEQIAAFREAHPDTDVTLSLPTEYRVVAHPELPTAISELLTNAVEHNPSDISITVRVQQTTGKTVEVIVVDTGVGIPEAEREAITIPRETPLSHCEGLGLWLVYWIVQQSGGEFTIETRESGGTRIRLTLPTAASRQMNHID